MLLLAILSLAKARFHLYGDKLYWVEFTIIFKAISLGSWPNLLNNLTTL